MFGAECSCSAISTLSRCVMHSPPGNRTNQIEIKNRGRKSHSKAIKGENTPDKNVLPRIFFLLLLFNAIRE